MWGGNLPRYKLHTSVPGKPKLKAGIFNEQKKKKKKIIRKIKSDILKHTTFFITSVTFVVN